MNFQFTTHRSLETIEFRNRPDEKPQLAVILMHGYGANAQDLAPLAPILDPGFSVHWIFPEAPLDLERTQGGGRAWFQIDLERLQRVQMGLEGPRTQGLQNPEGLKESTSMLAELVGETSQELQLQSDRIVVGGFSQGSMMAMNWMLTSLQKTAGLILYSTHIVNEPEWTSQIPLLSGTRYFQSHGRQDPLLSFESANRLNKILNQNGWRGQLHAFEGGHEIPPAITTLTTTFLRKSVQQPR